jgi:hypothetical protein
MKNLIKGAMLASVVTLGLSLSACGSESANASAAATPDPAEQTAASIDQGAPGAPQEAPPPEKAAK